MSGISFLSSGLEVHIAHSVEEIGPEAWNSLSSDQPFASYRWYRFGEAVLADCQPVYIILTRGGEPLARATFWLVHNEPLELGWLPVRYLLEAFMRRWPLLICHAPVVDAPGLILPEPPLRAEALHTLAQAAREQMRQYAASFVLANYLERVAAEQAGWPIDFRSIHLFDPATKLVIAHQDFEEYIGSLHRSARRNYRRHTDRAQQAGIKIERQEGRLGLDKTFLNTALTLIGNAERRHGSTPNPWARALLSNMGLVESVWITAHIDDRLVGCCVFLHDNGAGCLKLLGMDYRVPYVYFQLLYEGIRCAIDSNCRVLWGGSGAYELKYRLGFQPYSNNYQVVAAGNRWWQWVVRCVMGG